MSGDAHPRRVGVAAVVSHLSQDADLAGHGSFNSSHHVEWSARPSSSNIARAADAIGERE